MTIKQRWNEKAYSLLQSFILTANQEFLCEDFRLYCEAKGLDAPTSLRSYGGIIRKAAFNRLIQKTGIVPVKNPKAHNANAAKWARAKN